MTSSPSLTARVAEYGNERSHCWREKKGPGTIISYLSHSGETFQVCRGRPAQRESQTLSEQTYDTVYEEGEHQHLHLAVSCAQTLQDG